MLTRLALILALLMHPVAIAAGSACRAAPARNQVSDSCCCCEQFCSGVASATAEMCGCAASGKPGSQPEAPPPPPEVRIDLAPAPAVLTFDLGPDARTLPTFSHATRLRARAVPLNILHCTWRT